MLSSARNISVAPTQDNTGETLYKTINGHEFDIKGKIATEQFSLPGHSITELKSHSFGTKGFTSTTEWETTKLTSIIGFKLSQGTMGFYHVMIVN